MQINYKTSWEDFQQYQWIQDLKNCKQDPIHHAEGDVWIHTKMVLDEVLKQNIHFFPEDRCNAVFLTCLMHDIGKPKTTIINYDGSVTAKGHSKVGELMARKILWEMGCTHDQRELICNLIAYHQIPFFLIEKEYQEAKKIVHKLSLIASNELLIILAYADILGRKCQDLQKVLDNIKLFEEFCIEEACLYYPIQYPNDHTRFMYFNSYGRDPNYEIYDDFSENYVYVMSGLPGSGKDYYIKNNLSHLPVISLDGLRDEFDIDSEDNQGKILQEAKERAKQFLRKKESFVWNATNINKQRRDPILGMIHDYKMKSHIVYVETSKEKLLEQNKNRKNKVPIHVIDKMSSKWEPSTLLECHKLTKVINEN